jgi:hypothetical protein
MTRKKPPGKRISGCVRKRWSSPRHSWFTGNRRERLVTSTSRPGAGRRANTVRILPLACHPFQLTENSLDVFHAGCDSVGHRGRYGLFVVAIHEAMALQQPHASQTWAAVRVGGCRCQSSARKTRHTGDGTFAISPTSVNLPVTWSMRNSTILPLSSFATRRRVP